LQSKPKVAVLIGTRPGIIKMSPIIHELGHQDVDHLIIHTGQHYSLEMDRIIMQDVGLNESHYQIKRPEDCISHAQQTAYMLVNIEKILMKEQPNIILVCGDANTNMAGALAARKIHIPVGHVEAGLRSFDWRMPEEHNRIIIDHISEYLFAPTDLAKEHLISDGVQGSVFVVGNTIVDALKQHVQTAVDRYGDEIERLTRGGGFITLTMHREENVDNPEVLSEMIGAMFEIIDTYDLQIVFSVHPRTLNRLDTFGLSKYLINQKRLKVVQPLGYLKFLALLKKSFVVMTDSGGIQEESCILHVPCITLRKSTERQETIKIGANCLAGVAREGILSSFGKVYEKRNIDMQWEIPYGDGKASKRIVETCLSGHPNDEWISPIEKH
jgi:UDP-N-acetylglucosamine 2-epimerase (non-hydrolysing)